MEFLTPDGCAAWAANHGFEFAGAPSPEALIRPGFETVEFAVPADAGRRVGLSRVLWRTVTAGQPDDVLLWVTAWGIWPSSDHPPLAQALRQAHGEKRGLAGAPGHLFSANETDAALSFLVIAVLFLWDAYLLAADGSVSLFVSHDERGVAVARTADLMSSLRDWCSAGPT
jgi:putative intracellular protease/amidase